MHDAGPQFHLIMWNPAHRWSIRESEREHVGQRHPGDRPRRAAARRPSCTPTTRSAFADLEERDRARRSRPPRGCCRPSSAPAGGARRPGHLRRRPALRLVRHPPRPEGGAVGLARPGAGASSAKHTGETVNLGVTRGERVVQIAQVDSTLPARHPRLDRGRRARPLLGARQGASTPGARCRCRPAGSSAGPTPPWRPARSLRRDGIVTASAAGAHPRRARDRAHRHRRTRPGPGGDVVAALGVSGPTARLEDRLDDARPQPVVRRSRPLGLLRGRIPTTANKEGVA